MYSVVLLVALGGVPAQGASDWYYTGGGIPLPPVANSAFGMSLNQPFRGSFILPAARVGWETTSRWLACLMRPRGETRFLCERGTGDVHDYQRSARGLEDLAFVV